MGAMMVMETDHETAQYAGDYRWRRVIDFDALLFSLQGSQRNVPLSLDSAEAQKGRPLTAKIAGVSRRVHRRAYRCAVYGTAVFCDLSA
jgi:hypothetical protein